VIVLFGKLEALGLLQAFKESTGWTLPWCKTCTYLYSSKYSPQWG